MCLVVVALACDQGDTTSSPADGFFDKVTGAVSIESSLPEDCSDEQDCGAKMEVIDLRVDRIREERADIKEQIGHVNGAAYVRRSHLYRIGPPERKAAG